MSWAMDWAYIAGFLDGEGTVGSWKSRGKEDGICRLSWYNTHRETLQRMHAFMGVGSLRERWKSGESSRKIQYELNIGAQTEIVFALVRLIPYMIEKRARAEKLLRHFAQTVDIAPVIQTVDWSMDWSYMAAFLDGEGTIGLYTTQKRADKHSCISWANTHLETLQRMQAFMHMGHIRDRGTHSGFNGKKRSYVLELTTKEAMVAAIEGMLPYLIQKREKAEKLLAHLEMNVDATRSRNYGKLLTIPADTLWQLYHYEGLSFAAIAARYDATTGGIARVFHLHGLDAREAGGHHLKGQPKSEETRANMRAARAKMWEDPIYAARQRAQLALGHAAPRSKGYTKPAIQGEKHPRSKLTDAQTAEIYTRYQAGQTSLQGLATEYGVSKKTILNIVQGKIRTHVTAALAPAPSLEEGAVTDERC